MPPAIAYHLRVHGPRKRSRPANSSRVTRYSRLAKGAARLLKCSLIAAVTNSTLIAAPRGDEAPWQADTATAINIASGWRTVPAGQPRIRWPATGTPADQDDSHPPPIADASPVDDPTAHQRPARRTSLSLGQSTHTPSSDLQLPNTSEITRLAVATIAVALFAGIGLFLLRRSRWDAMRRSSNPSPLRHGGSIPLGPRNCLHLVTVGEHRFLVAVDPRGVSSIAPVTEPFPDMDTSTLDETGGETTSHDLIFSLLPARSA